MRKARGRWTGSAMVFAGAALGCGDGATGGAGSESAFSQGTTLFPEAVQVAAEDFVGAESCRSCHQDQYDRWQESTHGRAGGPASADLVIAPFDGTPIVFGDGTVIPTVDSDGTYLFLVRQDDFDEQRFTVDGVIGGGHLLGGGTQGFVSRQADGTVRFLPFDFSRQQNAWFCNTGSRLGRGWLLITDETALADCGDWPPVRVLGTLPRFANCQSCHGSQIEAELAVGSGVRTVWESLSVNCETCHGPGREHTEWAQAGGTGGDIGFVSRVLDGVDGSLDVCFQCHVLKDVVQEGYLTGESLSDHYALKLPILGDDPYLPDGRVKTFAYQGTHLSSACYLDGAMTCVSCHEPHGQGYWDVNRKPLATEIDDGQCTACHGSKVQDPEAHSFHPVAAEVSCVACHMPYLQHPEVGGEVAFARSDHTIPIPRPALDGRLGVVSACRTCHQDQGEAQLQAQVDGLWGDLKPHDPLVTALLNVTGGMGADEAAGALLRPDQKRPMAQFQALARLATGWANLGRPFGTAAMDNLGLLASSEDVDVRSLALATLHYVEPNGLPPSVDPAEESMAVRRRWAMILSYFADRALEAGRGAEAQAVYEKALAVLPGDKGVLRSLGLVHNQTGDFARAVELFTQSLAAYPNQPLTYVNLGIALAASGDPGGAIRSYRSALSADPNEALAYFNLGNVHLRAGNLAEAVPSYQRAVALDPGLGQGHFNLAVALIRLQRLAEALPHARRAVEFSPNDDRARQMLRDLEGAVGGD